MSRRNRPVKAQLMRENPAVSFAVLTDHTRALHHFSRTEAAPAGAITFRGSVPAAGAAGGLRRARRLGKNHPAKVVQDLAQGRGLRGRHDQMELVGADSADY